VILVPVLNRFLHWSVIGILSPVLVLLIMSRGIAVETVGLVMALMSASIVLLELPSGILSDLIGRKKVYLLSIVIAIIALSIVSLSRGMIGIGVGFVLYGASRAFSSGSIESTYIDDFIARNGKAAFAHLHHEHRRDRGIGDRGADRRLSADALGQGES
jgi:DHA1 family quinolone resistance protein-like MFS transporter